ncbi:hypothetical protein GHT06_013517 [Daphnia sinensis]|uniref:Uncharacterized protein n=1 Tax=Daphnia sinensis TaxID=1820382 RepID=A0AAD5LCQ7_9CRUS|nr:hypothetical protein GHT06_013517 [Daphnia sinensis]
MWKVEIVKELIPSKDGQNRSDILKTPNGNLINKVIQSLHPLELGEDQEEDLKITNQELKTGPEQEPKPEGFNLNLISITATLWKLCFNLGLGPEANESIEGSDDTAIASCSGTVSVVSPPKKRNRFLDDLKRKASAELSEVDRYINGGYGVLEDLNRYPTIKQIFMYIYLTK